MLDKKVFLKCINTLLLFGSVEPEDKKTEMYYTLMAGDFENEEFSRICRDICKEENLFGKYPTPNMFYSRKEQDDPNVLVCLESGSLDISEQANNCISKMSDGQYNTMIDWIKRKLNGKTLKKSKLSEMIIGFYNGGNQQKQDYIGLSEIKQLLENHYMEENYDA